MAPLRSLGNIRSAFDDFYARTGKDAVNPPPVFSASGGFKNSPGNGYTYHVFTSSGSLICSGGSKPVEYLVVASGGSGSSRHGGGGGAGGGLHNISGVPGAGSAMTLNPGTYPVSVATSGGSPVSGPDSNDGNKGSDSVFNGPSTITAAGGGASTDGNGTNCDRSPGGCGGASHDGSCPRAGTQGGDGGISGSPSPGGNNSGGPGGNGKSYGTGFAGPLIGAIMTANSVPAPEVSAFETAVGPTGLYAGGGGGGQWGNGSGPAGAGGGGMGGNGSPSLGAGVYGVAGPGGGGTGGVGPDTRAATPGVKYTGGGGGGAGGTASSGAGGAGIVIVRYQP